MSKQGNGWLFASALLVSLGSVPSCANEITLGIPELFRRIEGENLQVKASETTVALARDRQRIARTARLPTVTASWTPTYLGDAKVLDKDFDEKTTVAMPHFGNTFSLSGSQLLYKGGMVSKSIERSDKEREVADLSRRKTVQDLQITALNAYLELFRMRNQSRALEENIRTASLRLENIRKMQKEGMVTENDVLRAQMQISGIRIRQEEVATGMSIANEQLRQMLRYPAGTSIVPDSSILDQTRLSHSESEWKDISRQGNPGIEINRKQIEIGEIGVSQAWGRYAPTVALIAGIEAKKPITTRLPVVDMYSRGWYAGFNLTYELSSLYTSHQQVSLAKASVAQLRLQSQVQQEQVDLEVSSAFRRLEEARAKVKLLEADLANASENQRILERKYLAGLTLFVDLQDADNLKLSSELQMISARTGVIQAQARLQHLSGNFQTP